MSRFPIAVVALVVPTLLAAQSGTPREARLQNALPPNMRVTQLVIAPHTQRVYFTDSVRALWMYDRSAHSSTRLADGEVWDLTMASSGIALAYRRSERTSSARHVWVMPLDARTGRPTGAERRASALEGDSPSISPDGRWLAFAHDDSAGVGQGVSIVPVDGGPERTLVPLMRSGVSNIRWTADSRSVTYGVNAPVGCDPDWSCLPLKAGSQVTSGMVRRISASGGAPVTVTSRVGSGWPGLSPDGSLLAFSDTAGQIVVADSSGHHLHTFAVPPRQTIEDWLAPETLVLSDRGDVRRIHSYEMSGGPTRILLDTLEQLVDFAHSPRAPLLAALQCVADRCAVRLWDDDGSLRRTVELPERNAGSSTWSPDGTCIAYVGGVGATRRLIVVDTGGRVQSIATLTPPIASVVWTPDSRALIVSAISGGGGPQRKVSFERVGLDGSMRTLRTLALGPSPSTGVAIDDSLAVVLRGREQYIVHMVGDSSDVLAVPKTDGDILEINAVSRDRTRIASRHSRSPDDYIRILDVFANDGRHIATIETPMSLMRGPNAIRFTPDGRQLVVIGGPTDTDPEGGVFLIDIATQKTRKLVSIPLRALTPDLALSGDGRTLLYSTASIGSPRVFLMDLSSLSVRK